MDKKDNKPLDPQIAANMGNRPVVRADLSPKKPKMPEARGGTGKGTPPPFPLVDQKDIHNYTEAGPKRPEEVFGYHQAGKFDPELNELALKEVAEQRGITVEQLLADKNLGKKLARKVEPAMEDKTVVANVSEFKNQISQETQAKSEEIELLELELKIKKAKLQAQTPQAPQIQLPSMMKEETPKKSITNPIIQKMREKLSIERIKPASVEIEGIKFELLPPPSSMYPWVMNRLGDASPLGKDGVKIALQQATAAVSIMTIEGQAAAIVLGLALEVEVPDPYYPPQVVRELQAQALYEMLQGNPTMEHLFRFNPDMGQKIYNAFQISFRDLDLTSSLDPSLRHYTCPVPDCAEDYDLRLEKGTTVFCKIHGVPMDDRGLSKEVKSLPLL